MIATVIEISTQITITICIAIQKRGNSTSR